MLFSPPSPPSLFSNDKLNCNTSCGLIWLWCIHVLEVLICSWSLFVWPPTSCDWAFPLCEQFFWRTDTIIFAKLNKPSSPLTPLFNRGFMIFFLLYFVVNFNPGKMEAGMTFTIGRCFKTNVSFIPMVLCMHSRKFSARSRLWDKVGSGAVSKNFFSALQASVWSTK